jgi:hypothetical protein
LLRDVQERAEGLKLGNHSVLGGDQSVCAIALAFEVRPVTSRTLPLSREFGLNGFDLHLEDGDHPRDRLVTTW